jgi:hypothetical protein
MYNYQIKRIKKIKIKSQKGVECTMSKKRLFFPSHRCMSKIDACKN